MCVCMCVMSESLWVKCPPCSMCIFILQRIHEHKKKTRQRKLGWMECNAVTIKLEEPGFSSFFFFSWLSSILYFGGVQIPFVERNKNVLPRSIMIISRSNRKRRQICIKSPRMKSFLRKIEKKNATKSERWEIYLHETKKGGRKEEVKIKHKNPTVWPSEIVRPFPMMRCNPAHPPRIHNQIKTWTTH